LLKLTSKELKEIKKAVKKTLQDSLLNSNNKNIAVVQNVFFKTQPMRKSKGKFSFTVESDIITSQVTQSGAVKSSAYKLIKKKTNMAMSDRKLESNLPKQPVLFSMFPTTRLALQEFYNSKGGKGKFPQHYRNGLEALLYGQEDVQTGNFNKARKRVENIFAKQPLYSDTWVQSHTMFGLNVGSPIAYYGLRMLDFVTRVGDIPTIGTLQMTVVVAPCASVTRVTLPNYKMETVQLKTSKGILKHDSNILHQSTDLFRRWVKAITGGLEVKLVVYKMKQCTTVTSTDQASKKIVLAYPDSTQMIRSVPDDIYGNTNFWMVIAPSSVPGDGSAYDRYFITGGMGIYGNNQPLFIADDKHFTRKISHIYNGPYSAVENRAYQPQWFQHEFMHHLYGKWSNFELEKTGHMWFDRSTWPSDFEGKWEPDYYSESIDKRLLNASPSLADGLSAYERIPSKIGNRELNIVKGLYAENQITNGWHIVYLYPSSQDENNILMWSNAAGVTWRFNRESDSLFSENSSPYGRNELKFIFAQEAVTHFVERFNYEKLVPDKIGSKSLAHLVGEYIRYPIENPWHTIRLQKISNSKMSWTNNANVSWNLSKKSNSLYSVPSSPYGEEEILFLFAPPGSTSVVAGLQVGPDIYMKTYE